jgi:sialic acid synthase SpsE
MDADPVVSIAGRSVGEAWPPYVIAEVGVHHLGNLELAASYVAAAQAAGADAVKFQTYTADSLTTKWAPTYWDAPAGETQHSIFSAKRSLSAQDYREIAALARDLDVDFLSTPFDEESVSLLRTVGVPAFKVASADVTDLPLLEAIARVGLPVLLSTGASELDEVRVALEAVRAQGAPAVLMHCSLAYPTPLEHANLGRLSRLAAAFPDVVLGYSDHTLPDDSELACPLSVALGARVIEKHFTLDRTLAGDDHYHSVDAEGLARLVGACHDAWLMTRRGPEVSEVELPARSLARRSIVAARTIPAGRVITRDDVDFKRPGTGMSPARLRDVLGRRARTAIEADELIVEDDLQG